MIDNSKFIPKIPEIKTEMVFNHGQPRQQEQKFPAEKLVESVKQVSETAKETVISTVYAKSNSDEIVKGILGKAEDLVFFAPSLIQLFAAPATESAISMEVELFSKMTDNSELEVSEITKRVRKIGIILIWQRAVRRTQKDVKG